MDPNDDLIGFEEAKAQSQIANQVFAEKFKHLTQRLDRQESLSMNVITGSVVGLFFIIGTLIWGAWTFIANYNNHYLETEKGFSDQMNQIKKDDFDFREKMLESKDQSKSTTIYYPVPSNK